MQPRADTVRVVTPTMPSRREGPLRRGPRLLPSVVVVALCAAGCASPTDGGGAPSDSVEVWLTTADQGRLLARQPALRFDAAASPASYVLDVDAGRRYQAIVGFGAAFTDAATYLIQTKLSASQRQVLLTDLFSPTEGIGLSFMRVTMASSDLSRSHWSYDDMPAGEQDTALAHFSIENDREAMLPVIQQARQLNPALVLLASPWSPPGWMKSSGRMIGGRLRPDAYAALAGYFLRFLLAYDSAGVPVQYLTIQNEPKYEPPDYPGMYMPAADRAGFIGRYLGPLLRRSRPATRILEWDFTWDAPEEPLLVLSDASASQFVNGVAWHCYAGSVSAQSTLHDLDPAREVFLTECSGGLAWQPGGFGGGLGYLGAVVIDGTRNWARGVALWSLALDPDHGPHAGGCSTCRGVVTIDPASGTVTRNAEYYALGHASRFVPPGATRIQSSSDVGGLKDVAFVNPDGSKVLVVLNGAATDRSFTVRAGGRSFQATLPAGSLATYRWR